MTTVQTFHRKSNAREIMCKFQIRPAVQLKLIQYVVKEARTATQDSKDISRLMVYTSCPSKTP